MTELRFETQQMTGAAFPQENPLPPLLNTNTASAAVADDAVTGDYVDRGWEGSMLPYRVQDQYDRRKTKRPFKAAVLENEHLKATFMLELGGRLWSLLDKRTGRDLLHVNPVFQPANLAVRDAWFSGGVEWNISIIGHSPFTCSPVFAARLKDETGRPVLRMYEWERARRVPFQIDCWLSDTGPQLFVRVRIINPHDFTIPMYWWSNIAVDEKDDVRVLGPADKAYRHDYDGTLLSHDIPNYQGIDVSYAARRVSAADLYFRIPEGQRPWIAALNGEGRGLVHTSTNRLLGRKMFNWGIGPGGRQWQSFLAEPGHAYIEIQGGLARTQGEYVAMPGKAEWSWLESYGPLQADPKIIHSDNWDAAWREADAKLEAAVPRAFMDAELKRTEALADRAPDEVMHTASGWGALERKRRAAVGEPSADRLAMPFPDSTLGEEQAQWIALLETGRLPPREPSQGIGSLMVQPEWRQMLEASVKQPGGAHWLSLVHLGIMRFRAGDQPGAIAAWEAANAATPTAWAYRCLAVLASETNNGDSLSADQARKAVDLWMQATSLAPQLIPLAIECGQTLLRMKQIEALLKFVDSRPPEVASNGRLQLLKAQGALVRGGANDLDIVEKFFASDVLISNIREKEVSLSELWFDLRAAREQAKLGRPLDKDERAQLRKNNPPPTRFDFRLNDR